MIKTNFSPEVEAAARAKREQPIPEPKIALAAERRAHGRKLYQSGQPLPPKSNLSVQEGYYDSLRSANEHTFPRKIKPTTLGINIPITDEFTIYFADNLGGAEWYSHS